MVTHDRILDHICVQMLYGVMQSDRNNFWGDVVLDSVNMVFRCENSILDNIYGKQICSDFHFDNFKMHNNIRVALNPTLKTKIFVIIVRINLLSTFLKKMSYSSLNC